MANVAEKFGLRPYKTRRTPLVGLRTDIQLLAIIRLQFQVFGYSINRNIKTTANSTSVEYSMDVYRPNVKPTLRNIIQDQS